MTFEIQALEVFEDQIQGLDTKSKRVIRRKIDLIRRNPFRYKTIHSKRYSNVFRVRFSIARSEVRLVYVVLGTTVVLCCLLDRKRGYKDLEKYLEELDRETNGETA